MVSTSDYDNVLQILKQQGKKNQLASIQQGVSITDIITASNYYLTSFDFFLLSKIYKIPLIFLCRTRIPSLFSQYISFIEEQPLHCYIILSGGFSNVDSTQGPYYGLLRRSESIQLSIREMGHVFTKITGLNISSVSSFINRIKTVMLLNKKKKTKININKSESKNSNPRVKKIKTKIILG